MSYLIGDEGVCYGEGRGYFTFEFVRYETLPQMLENKVIEQAKALGNFADED